MSKCAGSSGGEPMPKRHKGNQAIPSALYDNGAWKILEQFLTMSMPLSEMDNTLVAYLGDRYSADDWVEPRRLLFSGDADNNKSLRNLSALWKRYIPDPPEKSSVRMSASRKHAHLPSSHIRKSHKPSDAVRMFISHEAEVGEEEEEEEEEEEGYGDGTSVQSPKVTCLPGPSAKQRLAVTFDEMATHFEQNPASSSESLQAPSHRAIESRMYLLHVQRAVTEYIAEYLQRKQFSVTVSAWLAGQLYVVADSPKSITDTLPSSLYHAVKQYLRIMEEEREAVKRSQVVLPTQRGLLKKTIIEFSMQFLRAGDWARVTNGALRGELGRVILTDHACGSMGLEITFDRHPDEIELCLQDIEHVFRVGDTIRVVAGSYLGLEGYVLKMCGEAFHVEVSKYYLDQHPLRHMINSQLPVQQHLAPPPEYDTIEIGDFIQVLGGEHIGKCGIIDWISKGESNLWFRDIITPDDTESGLSSISVPTSLVQRMDLAQTIQYTRERGYDVRPGDTVTVACGPEYGATT
ncbi:uncharacterized protein F5147DRAFT_647424 [Suillus discolor]|uniref:KOW domain-containing protein n=1 Tax=Suillus discolor TaxID=1912936 RepID=A0A9P7K098_9AGAM|nr:uncharacterized protein F5147DRAFT_647424 [Suillus discolor]KAG2119466.1 hypothetical protein F5147DRAFT_647424 [Suillus discolor]